MENGSGWTPKDMDRKTESEVERCYKKTHKGERSKDRITTRPENLEIESSMRYPNRERPKKKKPTYQEFDRK